MEPEIVYKMPLKGTVRYTTAERRGIAHLHNEEMERKYGWSPDGYPGWHDGDGRNKEYPLPYSPRYFYRFVHLFFSHDAASSIIARLEYDFKGDTADAFYIKALLARAEECNLFTPGAAVVLYADKEMALIETWEPGQQVNSRWAFSFNTFYGSKANRANRKLILNWLKLKAKESPVVADVIEAVQSAPRSDISLDSFLVSRCIITSKRKDWTMPSGRSKPTLDDLAAKVNFYPLGHPIKYSVCKHKPARMSALIDGLANYGLIGAAGADALVAGIGARYGQTLKKPGRPESDANLTYLKFYDLVESQLKEWESNKLI